MEARRGCCFHGFTLVCFKSLRLLARMATVLEGPVERRWAPFGSFSGLGVRGMYQKCFRSRLSGIFQVHTGRGGTPGEFELRVASKGVAGRNSVRVASKGLNRGDWCPAFVRRGELGGQAGDAGRLAVLGAAWRDPARHPGRVWRVWAAWEPNGILGATWCIADVGLLSLGFVLRRACAEGRGKRSRWEPRIKSKKMGGLFRICGTGGRISIYRRGAEDAESPQRKREENNEVRVFGRSCPSCPALPAVPAVPSIPALPASGSSRSGEAG